MQQQRTFPDARFPGSVVKAALAEMAEVAGGKQPGSFGTRVVGRRLDTLAVDTDDEFLAEYDQGCGWALYKARYEHGVHTFEFDAGPRESKVRVEAPTRAEMARVLNVFTAAAAQAALPPEPVPSPVIFIGHGGSDQWRNLKDHLHDDHHYEVEAYEVGARAGHAIRDILESMLAASSFAVLVMTAEDEQAGGARRARQNVVHELGLFQGRLGFNRAIVLLEEGTEEFSNIHGIHQVRYAKGNIRETYVMCSPRSAESSARLYDSQRGEDRVRRRPRSEDPAHCPLDDPTRRPRGSRYSSRREAIAPASSRNATVRPLSGRVSRLVRGLTSRPADCSGHDRSAPGSVVSGLGTGVIPYGGSISLASSRCSHTWLGFPNRSPVRGAMHPLPAWPVITTWGASRAVPSASLDLRVRLHPREENKLRSMWGHVLKALRLEDARVRRWTIGSLVVAPLALVVTATVSDAVDPIAGIAAGTAAMLLVLGVLLDHVARTGDNLHEIAGSFSKDISDAVVRDLSRAPGIVATYREIEAVPWRDLFEDADVSVVLLARFFNFVVGPAPQHEALVRFLKRGGKLTVVTSDFRLAETTNAVTHERDPTNRFYPGGVAERVVNGLHHLSDASKAAGVGEAAVAVFLHRAPLNYAGYCFDERDLILNPAEHAFSPRHRCPRVRVNLELAEGFREFWSSEVAALTKGPPESLSRILPHPAGHAGVS